MKKCLIVLLIALVSSLSFANESEKITLPKVGTIINHINNEIHNDILSLNKIEGLNKSDQNFVDKARDLSTEVEIICDFMAYGIYWGYEITESKKNEYYKILNKRIKYYEKQTFYIMSMLIACETAIDDKASILLVKDIVDKTDTLQKTLNIASEIITEYKIKS